MALKVRAAVQVGRDPDTVIIARTDSLQTTGARDAIERCQTYLDAGADVAMLDPHARAPRWRRSRSRSPRRCSPTCPRPGARRPTLHPTYRSSAIEIFPSTQTWIFARAYEQLCQEVLACGTTATLHDRMMPFDDVNELLDLTGWQSPVPAEHALGGKR